MKRLKILILLLLSVSLIKGQIPVGEPFLLTEGSLFKEMSTPASVTSGYGWVYSKSDNKLYFKNDVGTEYDLTLGGVGTVTSFSSGNFSPLFTTSVVNSTSTPTLSFTGISQTANTFYVAPSGSSGIPTFRTMVPLDIAAAPSTKLTKRYYASYIPNTGTLEWYRIKKADLDDFTEGYIAVGSSDNSLTETIGSAYQVLRTNSAGTAYEWDSQLEDDLYNLRLGTSSLFGALYNTVIGPSSRMGAASSRNTYIGYGINNAGNSYNENTIIGPASLAVNAGTMTIIGSVVNHARINGMVALGSYITLPTTGGYASTGANAPIYIGYNITNNESSTTKGNIFIGRNISTSGFTTTNTTAAIVISQDPVIEEGMQNSVGVGYNISLLDGEPNVTVIGNSAKAYLDGTYGSAGGQSIALGYFSAVGAWRAMSLGAYSQSLGVSSTAIGFGAYSNKAHADSWGRGAYNDVQNATLIYGSPATGANNIGTIFFGTVAAKHTNPAMPGTETLDLSTELNAGTAYTTLTTTTGRDANLSPSLTNTRGGELRLMGGASTGTAIGGNLSLGVTMAGGASNNTENTWDNALTIYGADARGYFDNGLGVGNTAGTTMNGRLHVTGFPTGSSATSSLYIETGVNELQANFKDDNSIVLRSGTNARWNFNGTTLSMGDDAGIIRKSKIQASQIEWSYLNNKTTNLALAQSVEDASYWYRVTPSVTQSSSGFEPKILWIEPTYNLTSTATQDVYGLYYSPTVTSVIGDHYFAYATSGRTKLGDVNQDNALTKVAVLATDNEIKYRDLSTIPDIAALSAETSLDMDDDNLIVYDASETANNKVSIEEFFDEYMSSYKKHSFDYYNEFFNGVGTATGGGDVVSVSSGTGAASTGTSATSATNVIGLVTSTTGTTATGRTAICSYTSAISFGGGATSFEYRIDGISALSTVTERYAILVGFFDTYSAVNQVDGIYFLYDEGGVSTGSAASANWQLVTVSNSVRTFTPTSIPVSTSGHILRIEINAAGTSVEFFIDGVSASSPISTNIPTGTARASGFASMIIKSIGTTARVMNIDYMRVHVNYTTPKN